MKLLSRFLGSSRLRYGRREMENPIASSASQSSLPDDEVNTAANEKSPPAEPTQSLGTAANPVLIDEEITYPEGGRDSWLVVLGAFCGLTASLGIYNSSGVFSAIIAEQILPLEAPSTLGWLFSVYAFVFWVCGVWVGPTFDAMGPRALIIAGTICTFVGILSLSFSTGAITLHTTFYALHMLTATQSTIRLCCHSPS